MPSPAPSRPALPAGLRAALLTGLLACALPAPAQAPQDAKPAAGDGQHDFDFEIGAWRTELKLLQEPLSDSPDTWLEFAGTSVAGKVLDGRANLLELRVEGAAGRRIEGLSLRLYNPKSRQWSLNFSNSRLGTLAAPMYGRFEDGRGLFYGQDVLEDGRMVLVRFEILPVTPDVYRFVQAFSADGGAHWEVNWIATDTRVKATP
ncbi:hypothetical protein [Luteimonas aquatica]|uniref:hypothetical protein n=1 Tax=Luteimonas aquatica TaxID=450364 RepID=UPI001F5A1B71|nr:hypothetical protein [Luteimonas aquatica]